MNQDFNDIRAYEGDEIDCVLNKIAKEPSFLHVLKRLENVLGKKVFCAEQAVYILEHTHTLDDFDNRLTFPLLDTLQQATTQGLTLVGWENITPEQPALFLTNHRDIVLDSAFLSYLYKRKTGDRIYIGIGTNLYAQPWIEDFVRANKAFSVIRGGTPRELLAHSFLLSAYILHVIKDLRHCVWLAQREGRAKDGNDCTQPAVLKMLVMSGNGTLMERLLRLNISPVSLSYEYDPCDYLKAREMQIKRDNDGVYRKTKADDLLSMKTGIMGKKGKVSFCITPSINKELPEVIHSSDVRNEQIEQVARLIDKHIHQHYHIFNTNRIAYDEFLQSDQFRNEYSEEERSAFMDYVSTQVHRIKDISNPDEPFLREKILEMYANPLINYLKQHSQL